MSDTYADLTAWEQRGARILDEIAGVDEFRAVDTGDPWSEASLDALEKTLLETHASFESIPAERREQYELFLGEGLRRRFGGSWTTLNPKQFGIDEEDTGIGISYADQNTDVVSSLLPQAYRLGTGTWWSNSFAATALLSGQPT